LVLGIPVGSGRFTAVGEHAPHSRDALLQFLHTVPRTFLFILFSFTFPVRATGWFNRFLFPQFVHTWTLLFWFISGSAASVCCASCRLHLPLPCWDAFAGYYYLDVTYWSVVWTIPCALFFVWFVACVRA
jgi:hypothetical protein